MNLDTGNFKFKYNNVLPKPGKVLISEPFLSDIYFKRSVVLITEHSEEGTVGFVLNKPVNLRLSEALKDIPDIDAPVSLGGPVSTDSIHYVHTFGAKVPNSVEILNGIYWGGDYDYIKELIDKEPEAEKKI